MKWLHANIKDVAPSQASAIRFAPSDEVWHLNLDQIESDTGNIVNKKVALVSESGSSTYVFDQRNVLYSKLRPYLNKVVCPSEPGIATTELVPLKPNPSVLDRRYLTYYLRSREFLNFANIAVAGVKMPRIIMDKFWHHKIPLPTLSEQRRIVEILDQADTLRQKRSEADSKAERILLTLFFKSFGNPLTNPMGWEEVTLDSRCDIVTGNTPSTKISEYYGDHTPWARPADLNNQILVRKTEKMLSQKGREVARLVPTNSILVVCIGATLGKVAIAGVEMAINQQINAILPSQYLLPEFLYIQCFLLSQRFMAASTKSTLPILNKSRFGNQTVICPPMDKQGAFSRAVRIIISSHSARVSSSQKLSLLYLSLSHHAFSGDLTSKWREAHMKELLAEMEEQAKYLRIEASA